MLHGVIAWRALLLAVTVFTNVFCAAVNAYTWRVAYPLWGWAGTAFVDVHREYMRRLTPVITVPHVAMFFSTLLYALLLGPGFVGWAVFALDTAVIGVSIAGAGPVHDRFTRTGVADTPGLQRLVTISAGRTALMLAACSILLWGVIRK